MPERYAMSPRGRRFKLTDEMIELRNRLATGLGYVLRPCSLGPCKTGEHRPCWEREALDWEHRGRMVSSYHNVPESEPDADGGVQMFWPDEAETEAFAIDRGKPRAKSGVTP